MSKQSISHVFREVLIRIPDNKLKRDFLYKQYFNGLQLLGEQCEILNPIIANRLTSLNLGHNVRIKGGGVIDAQAGITLGNNVVVGKDVELRSYLVNENGEHIFDPIMVGHNSQIADMSSLGPGAIIDEHQASSEKTYEGQVVFILSTGRSGTTSIKNILSQSDLTECYHDVFSHLNVWSCDRLYHRRTDAELVKRLEMLFNIANIFTKPIHIQSDQKLAALIPLLHQIIPNARFVWLIRRPDSFVNSAYSRGWYLNREFGYDKNINEFYTSNVKPSLLHATHRINGAKVNSVSPERWLEMTGFERNCWYWSYWNTMIDEELAKIPRSQWLKITLEDLNTSLDKLADFVGIESRTLSQSISNQARYEKISSDDWSLKMRDIFKNHCQINEEKWFCD